MKIVHITGSGAGGVNVVISALKCEQEKLGNIVYIYNILKSKCSRNDAIYIRNNRCFKNNINIFKPDIVIFHSIYRIPYVYFYKILIRYKIPYLIQPHGGSTYMNMKKSYFRKYIANILLFNKFVSSANAVVYLNEFESEKCIFKYIRKKNIIIPNGIYLPNISISDKSSDKVYFTFLARIDIFYKAIDILLDAILLFCEKVDKGKFEFNFYGDSKYKNEIVFLKEKIDMMPSNIFFCGPAYDEKKTQAFVKTNIYVLTSRSEGMPLSVLDALSYGNPCVVTPHTNMHEIIKKNECGWVTELDSVSIAMTLLKAMNDYLKSKDKYIVNSINAVQQFDWMSIAKNSIKKYKMIITYNGIS